MPAYRGRDKVLLAMSGGVDSSAAAVMLLEAGYDVVGVFMCLGGGDSDGASGRCCSPPDAADARRVAQRLGVDMFVLNLAKEFEQVIDNFASEYAAGRTPNPCIHCNGLIKFGRLVERGDTIGAQYVATGHHARIIDGPDGPAIARARARQKDQSYALFAIPRANLRRIILPIGEVDDKDQVRRIARRAGLAVHAKPDSQEICFIPDDNYVDLLRSRAPHALRPGDLVNSSGDVLGRHGGYACFTIGQRRGLGIAAGEPMYVTHIDPDTARVTIGPREEVRSSYLTASGANWHVPTDDEFDAIVQIRYNHPGAPARVRRNGDGRFEVRFDQPVEAITPGQAVVVYDGRMLLGGGWID